MGSILSGNFHRSSTVPFLDELPKVSANDLRQSISIPDGSSWVYFPCGDNACKVWVSTTRAGFAKQLRFRCPTCNRRCTLLFYLDQEMACSTCAGRYRVQSESPGRRTERRARKILSKVVFDDNRPDGRIAYRKHSVHVRLKERALWACEVICGRDEKLSELIKYADQSKRRANKSNSKCG